MIMADIKYRRTIVSRMLKYLDSQEALIIYGSRQVGKTSLMMYLMENHLPKNTFYLDLELPNLLGLCNRGTDEVYSYLLEKGANEKERIYLIIDEIQYMEDPSKFIKIMVDHNKNVKMIVTGSSLLGMRQKLSQSLAGRTVIFELYPLSFEEFLQFKGKSYVLLPQNSDNINSELVPLANEYIRFGGFPKIVLEQDAEKKKTFLWQIIDTYVRKDVRDAGNIGDMTIFNNLLEILASQSGGLLNITELANTVKLNRQTVQNYLNLLENTFIIKRITPFSKNPRTELSKNPKIYMLDTGMMHLLWLKDFPQTIHGSSFETFVFLELHKAGLKVNFWRTANKQEVDFIVASDRLNAIEAKYSFASSDLRGLAAFATKYPCAATTVSLAGGKVAGASYPWELVARLTAKK